MAETNECKGLRELDPVQGLVDYILNVKPFHTKIVEVLVEYVYGEAVETTITDHSVIEVELLRPFEKDFDFSCNGGYSLVPYGGPRGWPVLSPNQSTAFEAYPAINATANQIIVAGDRTQDMSFGDSFVLVTYVEDTAGAAHIVDVQEVAGTFYFILDATTIHGTLFTSHFTAPVTPVFTSGMHMDDGKGFSIVSISVDDPAPGLLKVEVSQNIASVPNGHFGITRTLDANTGVYTVQDVDYSGGTNVIYTTPGDVNTFQLGDDPHTLITVSEPLVALPVLTAPLTQNYASFMAIQPAEITKVISYSNFINLPTNTPDEGYLQREIVGYEVSALDGFGAPIPNTGKIIVAGNIRESNVFVDEIIVVLASANNSGTYTITSVEYDLGNDHTVIGVNEKITSLEVDGRARFDIPANMFYINGNYAHRFRQGIEFNVVGGSYQGKYMTLYSDFINGRTRIRPAEEIINTGKGKPIQDVIADNSFTVNRDKTIEFIPGSTINIVSSPVNDGWYTISTATYDLVTDLTTIVLVEDTLDVVPGGEVFRSDPGVIKESFYGYSEGTDFCDYHPELEVKVSFDEHFEVEGIALNIHNHLIAYNMENTDWWGMDTPIYTRYESAEPPVTESPTSPGAPGMNEFWFNTDEGQLYYYSVNNVWIPTKTIYWIDTDTNLFFYRTMYDRQEYDYDTKTLGSKVRVDTDWVQMFANPPGFSDIQPAVSPNLNAHVASFGESPHSREHRNVYRTVAHTNQSYTLVGGNYVKVMGPETRLELFDYANGGGLIEHEYPESFAIVGINIPAHTIEIAGLYDWFFEDGVILGARIWNDTYHEMEVLSTTTTTNTFIEVSLDDINKFQGLTLDFGTVFGAVYDPRPNWTIPLDIDDQIKTYVLPRSGTTYSEIDGITYNIVEPQRVHTLTTDATIKENFSVDWGSVYAWKIKRTNSTSSEVVVVGDITEFLSKTNSLFITQSQGIDGKYEISSYVYVSGTGPTDSETIITLNSSLPTDPDMDHRGYVQIEDSEVVDWFQFMIVNADAGLNEFVVMGDATNNISNGDNFRVVGTLNDGTYTTIAPPTYSGGLDRTTIQVASIANNDTGGWVEHV